MNPRTAEKFRRQHDLALAWEVFSARQSEAAADRAGDLKSGPVLNGAKKPAGTAMAISGSPLPPASFQLRKILVPVDFSGPSENALAYATGFAREFRARLVLMHVISPITHATPGAIPPQLLALQSDLQRDAIEKLARWKATAAGPVNGGLPRPETYVCTGFADLEINRAAREMEVHLIIIATRGFTGPKGHTLGSTTAHLVRSAPCPVLVVREHEDEFVG